MDSKNFTCPYCGRPTTITGPNSFTNWEKVEIKESALGDVGFFTSAITCPNEECKQFWLNFKLSDAVNNSSTNWKWEPNQIIKEWQLLPESEAMVLPEYIPEAIKSDYYEACRICHLSAKASATLARRCIQGMIRDFWNIRENRLIDEIRRLQDKVDPLVWDSIDAVRSVGNIGAHMEKDINLIIDVDPEETKLLINLIELLIQGWYIDRHEKEKRLHRIKEIAQEKDDLKNPPELKEDNS